MSNETIRGPVAPKRGRGRPSIMHVFRAELYRRARAGVLEPTQGKEMRALRADYVARNPNDRRTPKVKTLRRKLGADYNKARKGVPN